MAYSFIDALFSTLKGEDLFYAMMAETAPLFDMIVALNEEIRRIEGQAGHLLKGRETLNREMDWLKRDWRHIDFTQTNDSGVTIENQILAIAAKDPRRPEAIFIDHFWNHQGVMARRCQAEITTGEHDGAKGYFTRYSKDGAEICITFNKAYRAWGVASGSCGQKSKGLRIPWAKIKSGVAFTYEALLPEYFIARVESGYMRAIYWDFSSINRAAFYDRVAEITERDVH